MKHRVREPLVIRVADSGFRVWPLSEELQGRCKEFLADPEEGDTEIFLTREDREDEQRLAEALCGYALGNLEEAEFLALQRKVADQLLKRDTLLMHASAIAVDGQAYLFAGPSGTGKTTHAAGWRELLGERAVMINDDKPFLQVRDRQIRAFGSPWRGKEGFGTNTSAPLAGIACLEQGPENRTGAMSEKEKWDFLLPQIHMGRRPQSAGKSLRLLQQVIERTPVIRVWSRADRESASLCYKALTGTAKRRDR